MHESGGNCTFLSHNLGKRLQRPGAIVQEPFVHTRTSFTNKSAKTRSIVGANRTYCRDQANNTQQCKLRDVLSRSAKTGLTIKQAQFNY